MSGDSSWLRGGAEPAALGELADLVIPFALRAACELRIADHLAAGSRGIVDLARATGTHAPALLRLMRALASREVFAEPAPERFALAAVGEFLRSDHKLSLADAYPLISPDLLAWADADYSIRTGRSAFEHVHGRPYYEMLAEDGDFRERFNRSVEAQNQLMVRPLLDGYDFSDCGTLLDVAGGTGVFLAGLLAHAPRLRGVLFDLPHVLAQAPPVLRRFGVEDRCELVAGDFFQALPPGADTYLLKTVLHDWDDARARLILAAVRRAMPPSGRLLVFEALPVPGDAFHIGKLLDLNSLVLVAGPDRDERELVEMLAVGGFECRRIVHTTTLAIIEAAPQ
jgi:O-methyltransferase domain